jgi:hypothetical protein
MANFFCKKIYVQLVPDSQIAQKKQMYREKYMFSHVREPWWREISLTAEAKGVTLRLGSVDENVAEGGCCQIWHNTRQHFFAWDDVFDLDHVRRLFEREQYKVVKAIESLFVGLHPHVRPLRDLLSSS